MERRLAAIMSADVVGYSRLIRADEEGTLAALKTLRSDLVDPKLAEHNGRIVKLMGDGMLAEFPSVVDAVRTAVETQRAVAEHNANIPEDKRIEFRIGINLGDVVIDGDDIQGDGVNIAARLEGIAEPGGICVSGMVYEGVRDRIDFPFEDLGEQEVKNVARPLRVWQWLPMASAPANPITADAPLPLPDKPSIAVLPFENMSGDPEQEYFSDGLTEDLITDLSKLSGLFVIARNTAFSFKGQAGDVGEIGRKLGVAHVLEGSVRKAGNRVRINAQLIETASGGHVWAERYDGSLDDIFAVQDEITEKIMAELRVRLTAREAATIRRHITENVEAYELYLNARAVYASLDPEGTSQSVRMLEQAIAVDPDFAVAYAALSGSLQHGWTFVFPGFEDVLERMLEMARRGVDLDDSIGLTHARLGWALTFVRQYDEAIASFERAIELEPNAAEPYLWFAEALNYAGNPARGLEMVHRFIELDPVVQAVSPLMEGHSLYLLGRHEAAIERFKFSISMAEGFPLPHLLLGIVYSELDRPDQAAAEIAIIRESLLPNELEVVTQRLPYRDEEPRRRMRDALVSAAALAS